MNKVGGVLRLPGMRFRLGPRRLLLLVAASGLTPGLFRLHPSAGVFAGCLLLLALIRLFEVLGHSAALDQAIGFRARVWLTLHCFGGAASLLAVCLVAAFESYSAVSMILNGSHGALQTLDPVALATSAIVGYRTYRLLQPALWPSPVGHVAELRKSPVSQAVP